VATPSPEPKIDVCNACGKLIPRAAMRLCTSCGLIEENRFQLVRDFLMDHDGAPVADISRLTGVSTVDVRRFMEGGRIVQVGGGISTCTCGGVGTRCRYCRSQLTQTFKQMEATMHDEQEAARIEAERTSSVRRERRTRRMGESG